MPNVLSSPFDLVAKDYDRLWTHAPSGIAQRNAVWRQIEPYFRGLNSVLDLGCGSGADAVWLRSLGIAPYAVDSSSAMVAQARKRGIDAHHLSLDQLDKLTHRFDGILSNFGVMNCVASLSVAAASLARLVRPGGPVAICFIGRFCLWETLHYLMKGRPKKALRRLPGRADSSMGISVQYPSHRHVMAAFRPAFRLREHTGIGICVPPSYITLPMRHMRIAHVFDRSVAAWPVLRNLADHRLYIFERL